MTGSRSVRLFAGVCLALTLGLEIYKFESGRTSERHRRRIEADYQSGIRSGVKGTPTLFINGDRYTGRMEAQAILERTSAM